MNMSCENCKRISRLPTRREFLWEVGGGLAGLAVASLLANESAAQDVQSSKYTVQNPAHFAPKAKHVIIIQLPGGLCHNDTFDYKPELAKHQGQEVQGTNTVVPFNGKRGTVLKSPWEFKQYGKSGKWVSDLLPNIGRCVDDLSFLHSMQSLRHAHGQAL